jgi:hypothetical protein
MDQSDDALELLALAQERLVMLQALSPVDGMVL